MSRMLAGAFAALLLLPAGAVAAPRPALSAGGSAAREGGTVRFAVTLPARLKAAGRVKVRYATRAGTATSGLDFKPAAGTLRFKRGQRRKTVRVRTVADLRTEVDERFSLRLSRPSGARLKRAKASGLIRDDDPLVAPPGGSPAGEEAPAIEQPDQGGPAPVFDTTPPPQPTLNAADPPSPANDDTPRISGIAEDGSTVRIYTSAACAGTHAVEGTAEQYAAGIEVPVPSNAITTISVRALDAAGNGSECSADLPYEEDSSAPDTPELDADPGPGPGEVVLSGTATPGTLVRLYAAQEAGPCEPAAFVETIPAAHFTSSGYTFSAAPGTWYFSADGFDQAGNASACSAEVGYP